jgi:flagellar protein FliO/FliZ
MDEASLLRMFLGLALIVGLILACGWLARRSGLAGRPPGSSMRVVDSLSMGPRQRIVMVEVDRTWLVVGVTAGQMNVLHTLPASDSASAPPSGNSGSSGFAAKLGQALRRR